MESSIRSQAFLWQEKGIFSFTQNGSHPSCVDWPRPVSRKTSEDGARLNDAVGQVKKSFLFEPKASLKDFSRQALVFRAKRAKP